MRQFCRFKFQDSPFFLLGLLLVVAGTRSPHAWGAACCARSPAAPFLILGDDQGQFNLGLSNAQQVSQVDDRGVSSSRAGVSDVIWNYRVDGAILLSDLWQVGLSLPLVQRSVSGPGFSDQGVGLGDTRLSVGYEILPLWNYSAWKPQGFVFSVLNLPTGKSSYQSELPSLADVSGNGFYAMSLGMLLIKRWNHWDGFVLGEGHYSFPRTFVLSSGSPGETAYQVVPGFGGSLGGGIGYSPGGAALRIGLRIQPRWDQLEKVSNLTGQNVGSRWVTDSGLDLSYLIASTDTLMMSYTDQTLLGPKLSAPLSRSLVLSYQHRWAR